MSPSAKPKLAPRPSPIKDIASELQRIARISLHVLNNRDFEHQSPMGQEVLACIASDYTAQLDNYPHLLTWKQLNDVWREWASEDPRLAFNMYSCTAHVDEEEGFASVFMDMDVMGLGGVEMKGFTELRWRREVGGKWRVFQFWSSRGMRGMDGIV